MINANKVSDASIFVSQWLKSLYLRQGISKREKYVVLAGQIETFLILIILNHGMVNQS